MYNTKYLPLHVFLDSQIPSRVLYPFKRKQSQWKETKGRNKRDWERERDGLIFIVSWFGPVVTREMRNWVSDSQRGASGREREENGGMSKAELWRSVHWKTQGTSLWTHSSRAVEPVWRFFPQPLVCVKAWQRAPLNIICLHGNAHGLFHCLQSRFAFKTVLQVKCRLSPIISILCCQKSFQLFTRFIKTNKNMLTVMHLSQESTWQDIAPE